MGLRKLANSNKYKKYLNVYQMVNPPEFKMKELGIKKLAKLVTFLPNPILLAEPDSTEPIDKVFYEFNFVYDKIKTYLDDMIDLHAIYLQDVPQVHNATELDTLCRKDPKRPFCLIFIVDKKKEVRTGLND